MEATGLAPEETGLGFFFLAMYGGGGDRRRQRRRMRAKDRLRSFALGRERKILCKCFLPLGLMVLLLVIRDNQENRLLTLNTQQGPYPLKKKDTRIERHVVEFLLVRLPRALVRFRHKTRSEEPRRHRDGEAPS